MRPVVLDMRDQSIFQRLALVWRLFRGEVILLEDAPPPRHDPRKCKFRFQPSDDVQEYQCVCEMIEGECDA